MIKIIVRTFLCATALFAVAMALLLFRDDQLDRGGRALKQGDGAAALQRLKPIAFFGDKTAQILVGYIYAYGEGRVPESEVDALYWFRRAGPIVPKFSGDCIDPAGSHALYIAKSYAKGGEGVKFDLAKSRRWLKLAADGGCKEAAAMLARTPD